MLACGRALAGVVADETALKRLELSDGSFDASSPFERTRPRGECALGVGEGALRRCTVEGKAFRFATPPAHYVETPYRVTDNYLTSRRDVSVETMVGLNAWYVVRVEKPSRPSPQSVAVEVLDWQLATFFMETAS